MSQERGQLELQKRSRQLLDGPLKHVRTAALAAVLMPLASVVAAPASAQSVCPSGGVCGIVWNDTNDNGIRDGSEAGIEGAKISICQICDGSDTIPTETGPDGSYGVFVPGGTYTIAVLIPTGTQASPTDVGDNSFDSDGTPDGLGFSVVTLTTTGFASDFGFFTTSVPQPGTGTPGYWKNHPEAWPVASITVGGVTYSKAQAIMWLGKIGKDKTTTMFSSLVSAKLNVVIGNDGSCVNSTIAAADAWMATYGPVGSNVSGSSAAWAAGEPLHIQMDNYNNGLLCAPHRN